MASWMITDDVLFRIRVTLSSRKTKVQTFRTVAQAYSLEGTDNDPQWQSIASGVPCTIKELESADEDSHFQLKVALADIQSGLSVWEEYVTADANYYGYQETFHTFKGKSGKRFGIRVSEPTVAGIILEHMYDLSLELGKQEASENVPGEGKDADNQQNAKVVKRRIRRVNTLSKKDISLPCNFVHVSGVSKEKDHSSGEHLSNFLERKMKSLSAIVLPSNGRKVKKSPNLRASTDVSHERIFAKALATSSQPGTPELDNKKPSSNVVQRNTWNFGMLRKQSGGSIKAEKPRKGLFRRNSFSGLSPSHHSTSDVVISAPVVTDKPASLAHQKSPDPVQPCPQDQATRSPEPRLQSCSPPYTTASASSYTPSPPNSAMSSDERVFRIESNVHYNTLPSSLRRSNSNAGCVRHHVARSSREEYETLTPKDYDSLAPRHSTEPMTLTRYKTEPSGVRRPIHYCTTTQPQSDLLPPRSCGSTSDLLLRRPARSQCVHMKEEEITAAAAATIARYTERMAKALQQFDDVLHDSPNPPNSTVVC